MSVDYSILGKEVSPSAIDKELRLLWDADQASTKASLMNFAIYSEAGDSLLANCAAVDEITREHACRAILMDLDRAGENPNVRAWITAHCNLSGGKKAVCCEQVAFKIDGYTAGIVRHTLFSKLDSDLPLVLWWQGDLSESYRESFFSKVDRLIVDSADWLEPSSEYEKIRASLEEVNTLVVQDLAWTRTYQFRLSIAALADHPVVLQRLDQVRSVKVVTAPQNRTSGLQLLAWFAELSDYQASADLLAVEGDVFTMTKPGGGEVKLSTEVDESCSAVGVIEVDLGDCVLRVEREANRSLVRQQVLLNGAAVVDRHGPADSISAVGLISSQLSRGGKNSLFKRILPRFLKMLG